MSLCPNFLPLVFLGSSMVTMESVGFEVRGTVHAACGVHSCRTPVGETMPLNSLDLSFLIYKMGWEPPWGSQEIMKVMNGRLWQITLLDPSLPPTPFLPSFLALFLPVRRTLYILVKSRMNIVAALSCCNGLRLWGSAGQSLTNYQILWENVVKNQVWMLATLVYL